MSGNYISKNYHVWFVPTNMMSGNVLADKNCLAIGPTNSMSVRWVDKTKLNCLSRCGLKEYED